MKRNGFTLIELLVGAIIGVLAAVGVAFNGFLNKSKKTVLNLNIKQ